MPESVIKTEGGRKRLVIDYRGSAYGADLAQYAQVMQDVVDKLREVDVDEVVLSEYYERVYDREQTTWLKEIADVVSEFEAEAVWSPRHLSKDQRSKTLSQRHDSVLTIFNTLRGDPLKAYLLLVSETKVQMQAMSAMPAEAQADLKLYISTLEYMRDRLEKTALVRKMKEYLQQLGSIPSDRGIYHSFFEAAIKPSFIGSQIFFTETEQLQLVDQYEVVGTKVYIYKHPDKIEHFYFINPPEYALPPEKYFLLEKTKEVVAAHRPENVEFLDITQARKYFKKVYISTIGDIAAQNNILLSQEEREELAEIVARYTIGYGILEIILSDRTLTDVYIDSPLGIKPIYVIHSKYGQCQTNIIFSSEEAKSIVSRFRALSGRPFDEAHPILDFDLPDLQTRVAVIGKPLALDGTAFAFRLHKDTPWTLSQFVEANMMDAFSAGLLSFFVDAQASQMIVGSRGAGKTSLLQAMMLELPQNLRIIIQEDTQEIPIPQIKKLGYSIQRLKTRPPLGAVMEGEVSAEDALRTALRLGDSVLIVGEVRSKEALALYEAMRIGAVGNTVMGTIHGESAYSIWDRVVNDLGVPSTSFKATDFAVVAAPIRFKGSLKRNRRLVEVTEIKKEWTEDPLAENGFLNWLSFDANKDALDFNEAKMGESEWLTKVRKFRGLSREDIFNEIKARGETKRYLVELKAKLNAPEILEAENTVIAHMKYLLLAEQQRQELGGIDFPVLVKDWKAWANDSLAREVMRRKGQ